MYVHRNSMVEHSSRKKADLGLGGKSAEMAWHRHHTWTIKKGVAERANKRRRLRRQKKKRERERERGERKANEALWLLFSPLFVCPCIRRSLLL
jgi:hypothetical protein